jgi:opacity protein-like surface antigen
MNNLNFLSVKKFLLISALFAYTSSFSQDSKFEIIPYGGYTFSARTNYANAESDLEDGATFGLALDFRIYRENLVEVMYSNFPTTVNTSVYWGRSVGKEHRSTPMSVEYFHVGGVREFSNEKVRPFTLFSLGATRFHATGNTESNFASSSPTTSDIWTFSVALGGGAKIMFSDRIGLRLKARLLMPMYFSGVGIYCGGGCGGGASFGIYYLQLDMTGGLIIGLGEY